MLPARGWFLVVLVLGGCSRLGFERPEDASAPPRPERIGSAEQRPLDAQPDRLGLDRLGLDPSRCDVAVEAARPDAPRPDAHRSDTVKPDTVKPDTVKPDALKPDTLKPDTLKPDAPAPVLSWKLLPVGGTAPYVAALWGSDPSTVLAAGRAGGMQTVFQLLAGTFTPIHSSTATQALQDLHGVSATEYFAAGENGSVLVHDSKGWSTISTGLTPGFFAIWGASASQIWAGGGNGAGYARLAQITPPTWQDHSSKLSKQVMAIWGTASNNVYAVGWSGSVARYDGTGWSYLTTGAPATAVLNGVWGSGAGDVWVVGSNGLNPPNVLLHFDGSSWLPSTPSFPPRNVCGFKGSVFVIGYQSGVYQVKTTGGFEDLGAPATSWLSDCLAFGPTDLYVAADTGVLHYGYH